MEVRLIGRSRKAWRENKKKERIIQSMKYGTPGVKNEFGKTDLTPYNAGRVMSKTIQIDDIKY